MNSEARARLFEEYDQVAGRVERLSEFIEKNPIFDQLPKIDQADLKEQLVHMRSYREVLLRRTNRQLGAA